MTQVFSVLWFNQELHEQRQHIYDDVENTAAYGGFLPLRIEKIKQRNKSTLKYAAYGHIYARLQIT